MSKQNGHTGLDNGLIQKLHDQAKNGTTASFVSALLELHSSASSALSKSGEIRAFGQTWILNAVAVEFLRYMIEDDYVAAVDAPRRDAASKFADLLEKQDWLDDRLAQLLSDCKVISHKQSNPLRALISTENLAAMLRLAVSKDQPIQVSSKAYACVPILEDTLTNPLLSGAAVDAFASRLQELQSEDGINTLCFIEKAVGPIGALSMLSELVRRLQLPAMIYRANYWNKASRLVGYHPKKSDRVALVYDLLVTGDGIREAASILEAEFNVKVEAAVVLFAYDDREQIDIGSGRTLKVVAVERYSTILGEVNGIISGKMKRTEHIEVPSGRKKSSSVASRIGPFFSRKGLPGKERSNTMAQVSWKPSLAQYSDLTALSFRSRADRNKAIGLLWEPQLRDMPFDTPDGSELIIPTEAVPYFEDAGIRIKGRSKVVSIGDLPSERRQLMRRELGLC